MTKRTNVTYAVVVEAR